MAKLRMLPGEHVVHRLHPSAWSFAAPYAVALLHAAAAWPLWRLLRSATWQAGSQASAWRFWEYLYGNAAVATVLGALVLALAALAFAWSLHARLLALVAGFGASLALLSVLLGAMPYEEAVPLAVAAMGGVRLVVAEGHRLGSWILLTDLRLVHKPGFLSTRVTQARYSDITDIDGRQGALGRLVGSGTLVAVLRGTPGTPGAAGALPAVERFTGVHPFKPMRELATVMVQEATASPALQQQQRLAERKERLARELRIGA